jgi:hypothetical protein
MQPASRCTNRLAFVPLGYERVGFKLGAWHDVGWWQLALKSHAESPDEPLALASILHRPDWERLVTSGERFIRAKAA